MADDVIELVVPHLGSWRAWLTRHRADEQGAWLVLARKGTTAPTRLTYDEALEAALCVGWIDGQRRRRDDATFLQRFTPRRSRSPWSARNVALAERLIAEGQMEPAGLAEVERARSDGRWQVAYAGQASIEVPADLAAALAAEPRALEMFGILTSQNRYSVILRTTSAGAPATRARRIEGFVAMLARGETPHPQKRSLEP